MVLKLALAYLTVYGIFLVFCTIHKIVRDENRLDIATLERLASEGDEVAKELLKEYQ